MKILVTGASGFVGNHVLNYLVSNTKYEIIATARNRKKVIDKSWFSKVEFIETDLYDASLNQFENLKKPDILIHLAWSNLPNYNKSFHLTDNLPNEIRFLEQMIENGIQKIVVTGTCFEYGMQEGALDESLPTFPNNPYAIAKDTLRRFLEFKKTQHHFDFLWLRLFYMYGEGQSANSIIPQLEEALAKGEKSFNMSGGEQIRDYLPIEEVAEMIVKAALKKESYGIFNISSGKPIKLRNFVSNYLKTIGKDIELNLGFYPYSTIEPMEFWGCNKKIKSIL